MSNVPITFLFQSVFKPVFYCEDYIILACSTYVVALKPDVFRYKEFFLLSTYLLVFSVSDPGFFFSVFSHSVLRSRSQDLLAGQELSFIILTVFILKKALRLMTTKCEAESRSLRDFKRPVPTYKKESALRHLATLFTNEHYSENYLYTIFF